MLAAKKFYPEGPTHVIPLLQLALPGIDPNDFKKTLVGKIEELIFFVFINICILHIACLCASICGEASKNKC